MCLVNSLADGPGGGGGSGAGAAGTITIAPVGSLQLLASRVVPAKLPCPIGRRDMSSMRQFVKQMCAEYALVVA